MVEEDPANAELRGNLAVLYQTTGRLQEALLEFRAALAIAPDDPQAQYN